MTRPLLRLVPNLEPATDAEILRRVAAGELGALAILYDRYARPLLRFAHRLVGPNDADDIVQSVFLRVVRLAHSYDPGTLNARPWLYSITLRVAQEQRRALRRFASALSELAMLQRSHGREASWPERALLDQGLQTLSFDKRSVLLLAEVEGFSGEEIAAMLSVPVGTVWRRLHQARNELRVLWGGSP